MRKILILLALIPVLAFSQGTKVQKFISVWSDSVRLTKQVTDTSTLSVVVDALGRMRVHRVSTGGGGGSSKWTNTTGGIYYDGNVGIGSTAPPTATLDINGDVKTGETISLMSHNSTYDVDVEATKITVDQVNENNLNTTLSIATTVENKLDDRIKISERGNVLINASSDTSYKKLFVEGTTMIDGKLYVERAINIKNTQYPRRIYAFGNSLTYSSGNGYYEAKLNSLLGSDWVVVNAGIPGNSTSGLVNRVHREIIDHGDAMYCIVWCGVNDLIGNIYANQIISQLQYVYTALHNDSIKVIALTIAPFKGHGAWTTGKQLSLDSINTWIKTSATALDDKVDVYALLEDTPGSDILKTSYDIGDHLHMTEAGYEAVGQAIYDSCTFAPSTYWPVQLQVEGDANLNTLSARGRILPDPVSTNRYIGDEDHYWSGLYTRSAVIKDVTTNTTGYALTVIGDVTVSDTTTLYGKVILSGTPEASSAVRGLAVNSSNEVVRIPITDPSQWTTTGSDIYYNTGNVGIRTTNPDSTLSVTGSAHVTGNVRIDGKLGIGTTNPLVELDMGSGTIRTDGGNSNYWNTAYGWGNHADEDYGYKADSSYMLSKAFASSTYIPKSIIPYAGMIIYKDSLTRGPVALPKGANGTILTMVNVTGEGALPRWQTAPVSSQWTTTGSDIYFANKAGVGTTNPTETLSVGSSTAGGTVKVYSTLESDIAPALTTGNWTLTSGWQYLTSPNKLEKYADGTTTATSTGGTAPTALQKYRITITVAITSGTATYTFGGSSGSSLSASGTYTDDILATTTAKLAIKPSNTSRFTVTALTITKITAGTGDLTVLGDLKASTIKSNNGTPSMTIAPNGNIGIGKNNPNYALDIVGTQYVTADIYSNGSVYAFSGSTNYVALDATSTDGRILTTTDIPILIMPNNSEKMRITSAGVCIATTSPLNIAQKIDINGSSNHRDTLWVRSGAVYSWIKPGDATWTTSSSQTLKENIQDIAEPVDLLNKVLSTGPKTYNYKASNFKTNPPVTDVADSIAVDSVTKRKRTTAEINKVWSELKRQDSIQAAQKASKEYTGFIAEEINGKFLGTDKKEIDYMDVLMILWKTNQALIRKTNELELRLQVIENKLK